MFICYYSKGQPVKIGKQLLLFLPNHISQTNLLNNKLLINTKRQKTEHTTTLGAAHKNM